MHDAQTLALLPFVEEVDIAMIIDLGAVGVSVPEISRAVSLPLYFVRRVLALAGVDEVGS